MARRPKAIPKAGIEREDHIKKIVLYILTVMTNEFAHENEPLETRPRGRLNVIKLVSAVQRLGLSSASPTFATDVLNLAKRGNADARQTLDQITIAHRRTGFPLPTQVQDYVGDVALGKISPPWGSGRGKSANDVRNFIIGTTVYYIAKSYRLHPTRRSTTTEESAASIVAAVLRDGALLEMAQRIDSVAVDRIWSRRMLSEKRVNKIWDDFKKINPNFAGQQAL